MGLWAELRTMLGPVATRLPLATNFYLGTWWGGGEPQSAETFHTALLFATFVSPRQFSDQLETYRV